MQNKVHQMMLETFLADKSGEKLNAEPQHASVTLNRKHESANLDNFFNKEQNDGLHGEMAEKVRIFQDRNDVVSKDKDLRHMENHPPKLAVKDKSDHNTRQLGSAKQKAPNIIIIEDDDDGEIENHGTFDEVECWDEDFESDGSSRKLPSNYYTLTASHSADEYGAPASELSDSSDEEDCLVMEPGPSRMPSQLQKRVLKAEKRPVYNLFDTSDTRSKSSDCEIIEDSYGKVRQDWEQAALRKRVLNALNTSRYRAESEESTSSLNHVNSAAKQRANGKQKGHDHNMKMKEQEQFKVFQSDPSIPTTPVDSKHSKEKEAMPIILDQHDSNHDCPDARTENVTTYTGEEISLAGTTCSSSGNDAESLDERENRFHSKTVLTGSTGDYFSSMSAPPVEDCYVPEVSGQVGDDRVSQREADEVAVNSVDGGLIVDRERLKETEEFQRADEEEWERRQQELQRQAQEAQRLRKRRKVEAERRLKMENRQKQRLEEIRNSQEKEEQNLGYKEQVRGQIRSELELVAATCIDMATLLRCLGIQVDGGVYPTIQQVNAAYKKALLRFHPDRIAAMAKSDPSHQVEAEETFKLISRMKNTLQPVSGKYFS